MQNKGGVLMKKGFSLITAIIFMVLIATLSLFSLNISSLTAKQTTDVFLREQAELLAQNALQGKMQKYFPPTFLATKKKIHCLK